MEFWGVEVKAGESLKVRPELFKLIHVSQAAMGESKDAKEAKNVPLRVTVGENSYVIGTLSGEDRPQLMFDLVFEKEFELSHGWKNGSVYFIGYAADDPSVDDDEIDSGDDVFEDEENVLAAINGKLEEKKADVKDVKLSTEKNAKAAEPKKEAESDEDSEDDSDDEDDSEDDSDDVPLGMDGPEGIDFSDDSEDDDDLEDETPKKVEQKKRPAPSPKVAPGSGKKAKQATPDKSGGKKGPSTPFAKQNGKPASNGNNNKSKAQSPKSGGQFSGNKSNKNLSGGHQKNFKGKQGRK
ncbi:hypothetical protein RND71_020851 [Anisodus tanguticus]|uniref:Nucleoplasmin-like domain-containing protein n=1 Tax=Anisodus tanguticus TaxID=243964 RepID=A0AAE1RX07_9SOLA|nr:hypothetical protein RND71_020851 [Anisodus tanguticus]